MPSHYSRWPEMPNGPVNRQAPKFGPVDESPGKYNALTQLMARGESMGPRQFMEQPESIEELYRQRFFPPGPPADAQQPQPGGNPPWMENLPPGVMSNIDLDMLRRILSGFSLPF